MTENRIHRATTDDGVEIAGRIHGEGPPLVFVHGALGDGETVWKPLLPLLTAEFTCYTMSLRGRGLSGASDDLSRERLMQDVTAFTDSIGEPTGVVGLSGGALLSLAAAENTSSICAVAAYEPGVLEVMSHEVATGLKGTLQRMGGIAAEGRMAEAALTFIEFVTNEEELAAASEMKLADALAQNVPVQLEEFQKVLEPGPSPTEPSALARIAVPVLLLHAFEAASVVPRRGASCRRARAHCRSAGGRRRRPSRSHFRSGGRGRRAPPFLQHGTACGVTARRHRLVGPTLRTQEAPAW